MTIEQTSGAAPEPPDPDERVAREEISRYYAERLAEADEQLTRAQDAYRARLAEQEAWEQRGEITPDVSGGTNLTPGLLIIASMRCGGPDGALRRWLTENGYDLGPLAEPSPDQPRKRKGHR